MKYLFLLLLLLLLFGCDESSDCCGINSTGIEISVMDDEDGTDLLDPNNPEAFQEGEIELYYKINGEAEEAYHALEGASGIRVFKHESEYRIGIHLNENGQPSFTYIKWNNNDTDTLKAEFRRWGNGNIQVTDVWFNGELKNTYYFEIVK